MQILFFLAIFSHLCPIQISNNKAKGRAETTGKTKVYVNFSSSCVSWNSCFMLQKGRKWSKLEGHTLFVFGNGPREIAQRVYEWTIKPTREHMEIA